MYLRKENATVALVSPNEGWNRFTGNPVSPDPSNIAKRTRDTIRLLPLEQCFPGNRVIYITRVKVKPVVFCTDKNVHFRRQNSPVVRSYRANKNRDSKPRVSIVDSRLVANDLFHFSPVRTRSALDRNAACENIGRTTAKSFNERTSSGFWAFANGIFQFSRAKPCTTLHGFYRNGSRGTYSVDHSREPS